MENCKYVNMKNIAGVDFKPTDRIIAENYHYINKEKELCNPYKFKKFSNDKDYIKFIEDHKWKNYFEVINKDITKLYYDLDFKYNPITKDDLKLFINHLIKWFNIYFNKIITKNDIMIYVRKEEDITKIKSIHLILPKFKIHRSINKDFIDLLLNKTDCGITYHNKTGVNLFDGTVYIGLRNFCLPFQTKSVDTHTDREFVPYNKNTLLLTENTENYIIGMSGPTEKLGLSEVYECLNDICNQVENSFTPDELSIYNNTNQPNKNGEDTIKVNQYNLIHELLRLLPQEFYTQNKELWKQVVIYLKLFDFEIDDLLRISADRSNKLYTHQRNKEWVDKKMKEKRNYVKSRNWNNIINKVIGSLNQQFNTKFHFTPKNDWDCKQLRIWIAGLTEIPISEIDIIFNNKAPSDKTLYMNIGEDWNFYVKALDITNTKTNERYNYWIDNFYQEKDINPYDFQSNEEIQVEMLDWLKSQSKMFNINGKWGAGKTHIFIKKVIEIALEMGWKILLLTENNVLNSSIKQQLTDDYKSEEHISIQYHQELIGQTGKLFDENTRITITSMESIKRCGQNHYDLIIFDEFESFFNHMESSTLERITPFEVIEEIKPKLFNSKKILCLDADLCKDRLQPIYDCLYINEEPKIHYSNINKWSEYDFDIIFKENEMKNMIYTDIEEDKKICIAMLSKTDAKTMNEVISKRYPDKNILCIWSGAYNHNGKIVELSDKQRILLNIEKFIIDNNIDIWIYTPSVKTGLSVNYEEDGGYFHKLYMITNKISCVPREAIQMLFRARNLIDSTITILLPKLSHISQPPSRERVSSHLLGGVKISMIDTDENIKTNKVLFEVNDLYKQIKISNLLEIYNRNTNFGHTFLHSLTMKHQIPINIIYEEKTTWGYIHEEYKEAKKKTKYEKHMELMECELLPYKSYDEIKAEKTDYKYTEKESLQFSKRKLFNSLNHKKYMGSETFKDEDGSITTKSIDRGHIIENISILYEVLLQNHIEPVNINFNNNIAVNEKKELAINSKNSKYIHYQTYKRILTKILPEFYNEDGSINLNTQSLPVLEFYKRMSEMTEEIKSDYKEYDKILNIKSKMDWTNFNPKTTNHKKQFYQLINTIVKKYGMVIQAPHNQRVASKYTITRNAVKINNDISLIIIHKQSNHDPKPLNPLIINENDEFIKYISEGKSKITTNKTKKQKDYCKKIGITDENPILLYKHTSSKWEKDGEEWKNTGKTNKYTDYKTRQVVIDSDDIDYEDENNRNRFKEYVNFAFMMFYTKYRIRENDKKMKKNVCYITDDEEYDDIQEISYEERQKLDKNTDKD